MATRVSHICILGDLQIFVRNSRAERSLDIDNVDSKHYLEPKHRSALIALVLHGSRPLSYRELNERLNPLEATGRFQSHAAIQTTVSRLRQLPPGLSISRYSKV